MVRAIVLAAALVAIAVPAGAQSAWSYRARFTAEAEGARANASSPLATPAGDRWRASRLVVASADASWEHGDRVRLAGGVIAFGSSATPLTIDAREAYIRVSLASWADVEAGKRLIRWGVGYGFSPTGVLDPPRVASDPTDRLGRNMGLPIARLDLFRGNTSLTVAAATPSAWRRDAVDAPARLVAARLRTVLPRGVEVAIVGSIALGARAAFGGNATHVIGDRLEWHGELLVHDAEAGRAISGVAGLQYTFDGGVNLVVEYHRNGRGLNDAQWDAVRRGTRAPGSAPARQNALFARAARAGDTARFSPELIVIRGLDDGGWTVIPSLAWTLHRRVTFHVRALCLAGPRGSIAGLAPTSMTLTAGASVRF